MARVLKRKLARHLKENVKIRVIFTTNKISKFCSVKDRIPDAQKTALFTVLSAPDAETVTSGKRNVVLISV